MLGSSDYGAQVAAYFGLPYCFAHFITGAAAAPKHWHSIATGIGRARGTGAARGPAFGRWRRRPRRRPARQFSPRALWRLGRDRGVFTALPSPEEAAARNYSDAERDASPACAGAPSWDPARLHGGCSISRRRTEWRRSRS